LINRLTHPKYQIEKKYLVAVDKTVGDHVIRSLENGIEIGDERLAKASKVKRVGDKKIRMSLHEGRNRQIKRMLKVLGYSVTILVREQFSFFNVKGLNSGKWRYLSSKEIIRLRNLAGLI